MVGIGRVNLIYITYGGHRKRQLKIYHTVDGGHRKGQIKIYNVYGGQRKGTT